MVILKESGGGDRPEREPIPEDSYPAICSQIIDLGTQYNAQYDKSQRKVFISWDIPEIRVKWEKDGENFDKPARISQTFTQSLHEKAGLRKLLENWRGKKFTPEELSAFDIDKLVGAPCYMQVVHGKSKDGTKTYANIGGVMKLPKGMPVPEMENDPVIFNVYDENGVMDPLPDLSVLPNWMQEKLQESEEFKGAPPSRRESHAPKTNTDFGGDDFGDGDDIPF